MSSLKCVCCGQAAGAYCSVCRRVYCKQPACLAKHPTGECQLKRQNLLLRGELCAAQTLALTMAPKYMEAILASDCNTTPMWHAYAQTILQAQQRGTAPLRDTFALLCNFVNRNQTCGLNKSSSPPGTICALSLKHKLHSNCGETEPKSAPPHYPPVGYDLPHDIDQHRSKQVANKCGGHADGRFD